MESRGQRMARMPKANHSASNKIDVLFSSFKLHLKRSYVKEKDAYT